VTAQDAPAAAEPAPPASRTERHRVLRRAGTVLPALLVYLALVLPPELTQLTPAALVRIPVEGLAGVALLLLLPPRLRRGAAALAGGLLGLLLVVRVVDMGVQDVLDRPFDPVLDWGLLDHAREYLVGSVGAAGASAAALGAGVLAVAAVVGLALSTVRFVGVLGRHRGPVGRLVVVLTVVWLVLAAVGAQLVAPVPVAARSVAALAYEKALLVTASLGERHAFTAQAAGDVFRSIPPERLLGALRGKDVVFTFVESYGRSAVEDARYAPQVNAVLDDGTTRLAAKGFAARSAFLTSSVAGGGSRLAHATFHSGVRIDNQQRYRSLVSSDRLTLTSAFRRAGWDTVGVLPGTSGAWPEGSFFGIDRVHHARNLGYRGPTFAGSRTPDQYTLAAFTRTEYARPGRSPLVAEIELTSSAEPWTPVPHLLGWDEVGDGSVYGPAVANSDPPDVVWRDDARVRTEYRRSIEYSLGSVISWAETYGGDDLVLVLLGDHQAAAVITGEGAGRDVPVVLVARDPAVLDRIAGWGWQDGLRPSAGAPVWPMEAFRDRFLAAFGG
jgi:hypothetical protein